MGLPLRMNNIHAPTVPSGPTTAGAPTNGAPANLTIAELQRKKANMEMELSALSSVLDSHGVDMHTSLVTADGFPRSDIDVAQIRTTRARVIHLRNDYKDLMGKIEQAVYAGFAEGEEEEDTQEEEAQTAAGARNPAPRDAAPDLNDEPFAKVNTVADDSPAAAAGLQPGDLIHHFDSVNKFNHDGLKRVAEVCQQAEGHNIHVRISRPRPAAPPHELLVTLCPRRWSGRGLLGCHIVPL
ncbi:hypothetical protein M406DRAFT_321142 [Cryphonectria parasitica EP155]|uniref:Probable 26S proteasome regulatory subunit p27 n=1 Tax=Cryphonectria parasitica (strain ATCC 38755 / EP155) TaxID=660469 RepID=A0A9P5CS97_CRYP1|nr:uncharacterized protein M406DRAFT_321142 [Cryphonectria parasitica EP155]KAF3769083.1 hypothetical protein M406DRAFT_321142 [Cryphonectria parasitica EP155]